MVWSLQPLIRFSFRLGAKSIVIPALVALTVVSARAAADISVADPALQKCVNLISKKNGWLQAEQFEQIKCHNKGIESTAGLEKFTALTKLSLYKNKITEFELHNFSQLSHLNIAGNSLKKLAIQNCSALKALYAFHNKLQHISILGCTKLAQIKANNNALKHAELIELPALKKLYLFDNELEILNIKSLGGLRYLDVRQNPMPDDYYDYLDSVKGLTSLHDGNAEDWD